MLRFVWHRWGAVTGDRLRSVLLRLALLATLFVLPACTAPARLAAPQVQDAAPHAQVALAIRTHYDGLLPTLPPNAQRHYAQRLYRITGASRYLPFVQAHAQRLLEHLASEIQGQGIPGRVQNRTDELLAAYPLRTERQGRRKAMLSRWGEIIYAESIASDLVQIKSYGLLDEPHLPGHQALLDYLAGVDFRSFLTDPAVLSIYAAQAANLAAYLQELGVVDLRAETVAAFRSLYPPWRDAQLSTAEYRNKIYGVTHFVIAASNYYQRSVPAEEFDWVLDEFAAAVDEVLKRTKEDIYTEVGISFLLTGQPLHPALRRLQDALAHAYDPAVQMIPGEDGNTDLVRGEHRNVLAIMLLDWPGRLHPGPLLISD